MAGVPVFMLFAIGAGVFIGETIAIIVLWKKRKDAEGGGDHIVQTLRASLADTKEKLDEAVAEKQRLQEPDGLRSEAADWFLTFHPCFLPST